MKNDWYCDFFSGLAVDLWRQVMPAEFNQQQVEFAKQVLRLKPGACVLDIGCGHGRHAVLLAQQGFHVIGVDISDQCLELARESAVAAGAHVQWLQADLYQQPNLPACDGILWMGNSFGYADGARTAELLACLAERVSDGGRLLIDTGVLAESILPTFAAEGKYEVADIQMRSRRTYLPLLGCVDIEYSFLQQERHEVRLCRQYVFMLSQVRQIMEGAGWRLVDVFSDAQQAPYRLATPGAYLVAEKA